MICGEDIRNLCVQYYFSSMPLEMVLMDCFVLDVPKVWTPAGGWWVSPKNWKMNTAVCAASVAASCLYLFSVSIEKERRPLPPAWHIPSQKWCKHAKEDDPSLS